MSTIEVKVPDIGAFKDVPVIEIFVKPGDTVKAEDSLITLESDKATMDVPAPVAGTVKELKVKIGDKLSEGAPIIVLESAESGKTAPQSTARGEATTPSQPSPRPGDARAPSPQPASLRSEGAAAA